MRTASVRMDWRTVSVTEPSTCFDGLPSRIFGFSKAAFKSEEAELGSIPRGLLGTRISLDDPQDMGLEGFEN